MIAYIIEESSAIIYLLHKEKETVTVLDFRVSFVLQHQRYFMHLSENLFFIENNGIENDACIIIGRKKDNSIARIYFSDYEKGFNIYGRYVYPGERFTIGSAIDDDIYIQSSLLKPHQITVDMTTHTIMDISGTGIAYINGHIPVFHISYTDGDMVCLLQTVIILHRDFLMMNHCENIYHSLDLYDRKPDIFYLPKRFHYTISHEPNIPVAEIPAIHLEEPAKLPALHERNLFFTVGPGLLMGFATLSSAVVNAYRYYMNGSELIELIPILLLPSVMILSAVLFLPLQNVLEKKKYFRMKQERKISYREYLSSLKQQYAVYIQKRIAEEEKSFPEAETIFADVIAHGQIIYRNHPELSLRLGSIDKQADVAVERSFRLQKEDAEIKQLVDEFQIFINEEYRFPWIVSLETYRHITIQCDENYMSSVILQICSIADPELFKIVLLTDRDIVRKYAWLLRIPHVYSRQGIRLICYGEEDLRCSAVQSDQRKSILINIGSDLSFPLSWKGYRLCFTNKDEKTDLLIIDQGDEHFIVHDFLFHRTFTMWHRQQKNINMSFFLNGFGNYVRMPSEFSNPSFLDLFHTDHADLLDIGRRWETNHVEEGISCTFGMDEDQRDIVLNLHESVHGPHGLISGTTGSGKSELILSIILSLAVNYAPEDLQFVIIDFKGGGIASALTQKGKTLPHIAGTLSNLDPDDMQRSLVSFKNECRYREKMLQKLAEKRNMPIMNLDEYRKKKTEEFPEIAHLVIIVDEFAELKQERPEFMKELITVARVGRSLGIHMILSTQKPGGVVNEQIWSNSRFKICLKVSEKQDSMEMLHVSDAIQLHEPGSFYFLCDDALTHGKAGYVNAPLIHRERHISIFDHMLRTCDSTERFDRNTKVQISYVIHEILHTFGERTIIRKLWKDPIGHVKKDVIEQYEGICVGVLDDYYHNEQPALDIDMLQDRIQLVYSMRYEAKEAFFKAFLYSVFCHMKNEQEIYIIDDLFFHTDILIHNVSHVIDIIDSTNTEKIGNLFKILEERRRSEIVPAILIITDLSRFFESDDLFKGYLEHLLEHADEKNIFVLMMTSSAGALSYRAMSFVSQKYALFNPNVQDIQSFFGTSEKMCVRKEMTGLIKRENMLYFHIAEIADEELEEKVLFLAKHFGTTKKRSIPCMPDMVCASMCSEEGLPLGIFSKNYEWLVLKEEQSLLIVSSYAEDLDSLVCLCQNRHWKIEKDPDDQWIEENHKHAGVVFMTLESMQNSLHLNILKKMDILFVGDSFNEQYVISSRIHEIHADEAVLIHRNRSEVIRLVTCE